MRRIDATWRIVAVTAVLASMPSTVAASEAVIVWPQAPDTDVTSIESSLRSRGVAVVSTSKLRQQLGDKAARAQVIRATELRHIEEALHEAQRAYLEQRWVLALETLAKLERDYLAVLADTDTRALFWETQLAFALAYQGRSSRGDLDQARLRIGLALSIDGERRPSRALYGPRLLSLFADVVASRASQAPRPVRLQVPAKARIVVDGSPVVVVNRMIHLLPGLHVVRADAIGMATSSRLVVVHPELPMVVRLPLDGKPPPTGIASAWFSKRLNSTPRLLAEVRSLGVGRIVWVDSSAPRARLITDAGVGPWVFADSVLRAALRLFENDEALSLPAQKEARPTRWWLWAAVGVGGAVVAGSVYALSAAKDEDPRYRVFAP